MNDQVLPPDNNQGSSQSLFDALVGDGKKFADKDVFAQAKVNADEYIKTLELKLDTVNADNKALRETTNSQAGMQELIDQYKQLQQAQGNNPQPQPKADNTPKQIDLNQIKSMIQQHDAEKIERANLAMVQTKIKEKWGDNVPASVREKVDKLGQLGSTMAKLFPDEFLNTIGASEQPRQPSFQTAPRPTFQSDTFKPKDNQERTWTWYEDMRKKDPALYSSKKMTVQMHNDFQRLGDKFMDGDFGSDDRDLLKTKYNSPF